MKNQKLLKVANVRKRMDAHYRGEISYSRAVELLNEDANKALAIAGVMPRFLKTKYTLEELDQYIMELSARTDRHIHRGKLDDIEKLIRWRRRYDALNGA